MKEIRIHGRGGQGNVLAAELLALAAFEDGRHVQAFPAFGAERTGAPVQAFVRLSDQPIQLRSQIYEPDIVIVQDPTLLRTVDVASGVRPSGLLIVNAEEVPTELLERTTASILAIPATSIALEMLGRPIPNTTLLGAFAAATHEITFPALSRAIWARLGENRAESNVESARRGFERAWIGRRSRGVHATANGQHRTSGITVSLAAVELPGSSRQYQTGGWRTLKPVFLHEKCNSCDLCVVYCPEGVVRAERNDYYVADFDYCKGCGICAEECPRHDIIMAREEC